MRHAKVFRIAETLVFDKAHSRHQTRIFKTVDGTLASNCKPVRPRTVYPSEESVKGTVSSHNLEFRAKIKLKQAHRYAKPGSKICQIRLTDMPNQARRYAKSGSQICQIRLTNMPNQAQDYAKSGSHAAQVCQTGHTRPNQAQIRRPLPGTLEIKSSHPFHSSLGQRHRTHLQRGEAN